MTSSEVDISVIIPAHNEGFLVHRTIRSVVAAIEEARDAEISVEIIAVLDNPTGATQKYFDEQNKVELKTVVVNNGDTGATRNSGIEAASGRYIALIDADDLFARSWLTDAFYFAEQLDGDECVLHPQHSVLFENAFCINEHLSSADDRFDWRTLVEGSMWTSVIFASRSLLRRIPFVRLQRGSGFGYEDWHWFLQVLADGVDVHAVEGAAVFLRRRLTGSRLAGHNAASSVIPPTWYLEPSRVAQRETRGRGMRQPWLRGMRRTVGNWLENKIPRLQSSADAVFDIADAVDSRRNRVRTLPTKLGEAWRDIHSIEPLLFPEADSLRRYSWRELLHPAVGEAYAELCTSCDADSSHVFLMPGLRRGGADLEALNYIRLLVEEHAIRGLAVVGTEDVESPWINRLPESVRFVNLGKIGARLFDHQRESLLATFLVQSRPAVIHNINSLLGFRTFREYGPALRQHSRLFVSVFNESYDESGRAFGFPYEELPFCFEHLAGVFADNQMILDKLRERFVFDSQRMHVHYQPVEVPNTARPKSAGQSNQAHATLSILWASRLDRQKRPDILVQIAQQCVGRPFHFHVHGAPLLGKSTSEVRQLRMLANVMMHGSFDGFMSLDTSQYDVFLYTSQADGMPNIVLEAMAAGLPVVASRVGGLSEILQPGETGFLVDPITDVDQYIAMLDQWHENRDQLDKIANRSAEFIAENHSWERFSRVVGQRTEYVKIAQN